MGLFCVNLHLRTTDEGALSAALKRRRVSRSRIVPAKGGWISVYEARASEQDDGWIRELAGGLSKELDVAAIAFMVHDSDIACYWLFDKGELLDEYNSDPDYFDEDGDGPPSPAGGRADVLVRYCRKGVQQKELAAILAGDNLFAERVIEQLAYRLGIDRERALADYRNVADGEMPGGSDDDDDGDHDDGLDMSTLRAGLADRMAKMLGAVGSGAAADPQVAALVQAAASGNVDEIDRLLAEGVAIDAEAPAPLPGSQSMAGLGQLVPGQAPHMAMTPQQRFGAAMQAAAGGGVPQIAMTPVLAAVINKQRRAAERLLDGGADPNRVHSLCGTAVHAATGVGDVELLRLLIDRGGDVNARNAQGQTPLQVIAAGRATRERLTQMQATLKAMGMNMPGLVEQMSNVALPTEGWEACEALLKAKGAR